MKNGYNVSLEKGNNKQVHMIIWNDKPILWRHFAKYKIYAQL